MSDAESTTAAPGPEAITLPEPGRLRRVLRRPATAQARITVGGVILLQLIANGLGVAVVVLYLRIFFPVEVSPGGMDRQNLELNLIVFGAFLAAMLLFALPVNALLLRRAVRWVRLGNRPSPRERSLVFNLPLAETLSALVSWFTAAVIFGALNEAGRVAAGIALAGLVTCTLLYLILERHFRPVYALALLEAPLPAGRRDVLPRIMLTWFIGSAVPLLAVGVSPLIASSDERFLRLRLTVLVITGLTAGGLTMLATARAVAERINAVTRALAAVARGRLDTHLTVDDPGELGRLSAGFNQMVDGLRERAVIADLYGRQVGMDAAHTLEQGNRSERRHVTVLMIDLRGYTAYSEHHDPEEVVALLNRFFAVVVAVVREEGGWVHKFEGDAALCVFGAPEHHEDHAARALRAAARLPAAVDALGELPAVVAVASGEVLAGYVGTAERFEFTVIGDVVNVTARLCSEAKERDLPVIVHGATVEAAGAGSGWTAAGAITVRGRSEPVEVWSRQDGPSGNGQASGPGEYGTPSTSNAARSAP